MIRSALVSARAALFRTAYNTKNIWTEWNRQLLTIASDCLPIRSWSEGIVSPKCWDTPPFSQTLENAFKGFLGEPLWAPGAFAAHAEIHHALQQADNATISNHSKPKIQSIAYKHFLSSRFPDRFETHISKHIAQLLELDLDGSCTFAFGEAFRLLKSIRKHEAFQVIKTWVNSWATSRRFDHDTLTLPCIFGCSGGCEDDLLHYLKCHILWSLVEDRSNFVVPSRGLDRLGINNPSKRTFHLISAIFQAYHGTKRWLKSFDIDLFHFLQQESNCVSVRRHFADLYSTSMKGIPGEESSIFSYRVAGVLECSRALPEI